MTYLLLRLLPKNLFSRLAGYLSDKTIPAPILETLIKLYCQFYKVNLNEVKKPLKRMKTFSDFFTRELKQGIRPIDPTPKGVVSPVDGKIAEFGQISQGMMVQTKGVYYSLVDLVGPKDAEILDDGYFITIYLSPSDYHRIHAPVTGKVKNFSYFSGNLWPVNSIGMNKVGGLFSINERIITPIYGEHGFMALVKVGALVVGKISVDYGSIQSNSHKKTQLNLPIIPEKSYQKGEEIGRFGLGSTVILIFEKNRFSPLDFKKGDSIKMGQLIGEFEI